MIYCNLFMILLNRSYKCIVRIVFCNVYTIYTYIFRLGATLTTLRDRTVEGEGGEEDKRALEILVRKIPEDQQVYTQVLKQI